MTQIADISDRLRRLAKRREDEGIYTDASLCSEAAAAIEFLSSSPTAQTGEAIAVKPLEWDERSGAHYADTAFGEACVDEDGDGFYVIESGRKHSGFASVDAAKTFVQNNHNIWVNDWLTHPAPAVPDAVEALEIAKIIDPHSFLDIPFTDDPVLLDMVEQSKQDAIRKAERILATLAASHMPVGDGLAAIAIERRRQIEAEGWTPEHDDQHKRGELARAGACYAIADELGSERELLWPWSEDWWKPAGRIRNLGKAGALIAAEIDRLTRLAASTWETGR